MAETKAATISDESMRRLLKLRALQVAAFLIVVLGYPLLVDQGWLRYNPYILPLIILGGFCLYFLAFLHSDFASVNFGGLVQSKGAAVTFGVFVLIGAGIGTAVGAGYYVLLRISRTHITELVTKEKKPTETETHRTTDKAEAKPKEVSSQYPTILTTGKSEAAPSEKTNTQIKAEQIPVQTKVNQPPPEVDHPPQKAESPQIVQQSPSTEAVPTLTPPQIQIQIRSVARECADKFSSTMNGIKWWANIKSGGPMIGQEWERFADDYNKKCKERVLTAYHLLQGRLISIPATGLDSEETFNFPALTWVNVQGQLRILFTYLNEFEKENNLPITQWS